VADRSSQFTVGGFHFGLDAIIAAVVGQVILSVVSTLIRFIRS
jgi:uncharacterized membrane protein YvlD (DUF360 family)